MGHGTRRTRLIAAAVKEVAGLLIGSDPLRTEAAWQTYWNFSNFVGHHGLSMIGMSVMDMAMWDIRCKVMKMPLSTVLGGHKDRAPVYASHLSEFYSREQTSTSDFVAAAEHAVNSGFGILKAWITRPAEDLPRLREAVKVLGPKIRWAIDMAQVFDANSAIRLGRRVADLDLLWIEDPLPHDDIAGLTRVTKALDTPVLTGENAYYISDSRRLLEETTIRFLALDLMRCGGYNWLAEDRSARGVSQRLNGYTSVSTGWLASCHWDENRSYLRIPSDV